MQMAGGHSGENRGIHGESEETESLRELIQLPRWVVYAQALLLVGTAVVFFMMGLLVGGLASPSSTDFNRTLDCRVYGTVAYRDGEDLKADPGAVVFILPVNKKPDARSQGSLVHPDSFQALDNEAIDRIYRLGGAAVRADENGQFEVTIDANAVLGVSYHVLIVSKNGEIADIDSLTKDQFASLAEFFSPVEDLIENHPFFWMELIADAERMDLPEVEF
jgi:hypothetical protein